MKFFDFLLKLSEKDYEAKREQIEAMVGGCIIPEEKTEK
jgi:hypothetical protein